MKQSVLKLALKNITPPIMWKLAKKMFVSKKEDPQSKTSTVEEEGKSSTSTDIQKMILQGCTKLHLGCGTVYKDGWINIDNNSDNNIQKLDINWDLRKPLPFPDNSADFIYNEHFLEHLTVEEGISSVKDFYRVLKPGGVMRIAMPDLEKAARVYFDENWKENDRAFFEKFGLTFIQTRAELININFRWWGHQWLYDWEELERRLKEAGCGKIKQCTIFESEYEQLQNLETRNESTLIAEVTKKEASQEGESNLLTDVTLYSSMTDGLLRIRITNTCNAKCRYCGTKGWPLDVQKMSMRNEVLYNYCKPLYEQIKILLLTGGDPLFGKESMPYCQFISEKYPQVTIYLETNGIAFTQAWQRLAVKHLMKVHVSVNASNEDVYSNGCWEGKPGRNAYRKFTQNIREYMTLLKEHGLEMFAPDISMVINKDTADDVRAFVKYALTERLHHCVFYFDYTENDMSGDYFGDPESARRALFELMKLERVLAGKFFVYFRLWIPLKETEMMQPKVEAIPISTLKAEYADILELAKDRSMKAEYEARQKIRKRSGKKEFSFDEDWTPTIRQTTIQDKAICFAPFQALDIYPDEKFECCGWMIPRFELNTVICGDSVDWDNVYNNVDMRKLRKDMINGCYDLCQKCCPLNPNYNEICSSHKYGYERQEKEIE